MFIIGTPFREFFNNIDFSELIGFNSEFSLISLLLLDVIGGEFSIKKIVLIDNKTFAASCSSFVIVELRKSFNSGSSSFSDLLSSIISLFINNLFVFDDDLVLSVEELLFLRIVLSCFDDPPALLSSSLRLLFNNLGSLQKLDNFLFLQLNVSFFSYLFGLLITSLDLSITTLGLVITSLALLLISLDLATTSLQILSFEVSDLSVVEVLVLCWLIFCFKHSPFIIDTISELETTKMPLMESPEIIDNAIKQL
ncbi:hypothetical protein AGLY_016392 [Aphis glycines]|uniref:Uncharacterized protein n=1 Tax=Aphis glycines TaxID=307491 RepID=A0A6G0SYQ6_APHGL|nr:hypothetical protein AGLY_016392 [Aphis glycines]